MTTTKLRLEQRLGSILIRGWHLDGRPGPARYGWASVWPCVTRWEGRTLQEILDRLDRYHD